MHHAASAPLRILLGLAAVGVTASFTHAADGTWNTTASGNWSDSTKWALGNIANGADFTATFSAPTPNTSSPIVTIAVDGARTIGSLVFSGTALTGTHNFELNGPGILTLSGTSPSISTSLVSRNATVNVALAGNQGLTLSNTGGGSVGLSLGGANTYTGLTQISAGVITVANNLAFGSTDGGTNVAGGTLAAIRLNNGIVVTGETLYAGGNGTSANTGALHTALNATAEWAGNIVLTNSARFGAQGASSELILSGVISDGAGTNASFSYGGNEVANGTITLKAANTYTGTTTVFRGTLKLDAGNNRLPTGTTLIIGGTALDATANLNGYDQTVATLRSTAGTGIRTLTNTSTTASTFTVNQTSGTEVFDGIVSGKIAFVKSGAGILNFTGTANTFTGNITVNGGTLGIASAFINNTADVSIASGAVFALNFSGTDTIGSLYLAGAGQSLGTYGSIGSGAQFESAFFSGAGLLNVTVAAIPEPSTAALAGGVLALALVGIRRRRR